MPTCPHCAFIEDQTKGNPKYETIDIGAHVKNLKEFLALRDSNKAFDAVRGRGVGIPCFVLEDGTVTLSPEQVGLKSGKKDLSCSIDNKKGC